MSYFFARLAELADYAGLARGVRGLPALGFYCFKYGIIFCWRCLSFIF